MICLYWVKEPEETEEVLIVITIKTQLCILALLSLCVSFCLVCLI